MPRLPKPPRTGQGALTFARRDHPVQFEIFYLDSQGKRLAKGSLTGTAEAMREAFRSSRARLTLDDGKAFEVAIVAHAEGSPTAYFESLGEAR